MKTFTNKRGETFLFVDVPEDASDLVLPKIGIADLYFYTENKENDDRYISVPIPQSNYEVLGLAKDVSEEVARGIVDNAYYDGIYPDHNFKTNRLKAINFFNNAKQSLQSLVQSLELNNPVILKLIK